MDPERHRRLTEIFLEAAEQPAERVDEFLVQACGDDLELLKELRELTELERRGAASAFLEQPLLPAAPGPPPPPPDRPLLDGRPLLLEGWTRYTELEHVASGGMGEVFRAFDPKLKRTVALKFLRAGSRKQVERFLREAEAQARVAHDNILQVYETGEVNGQLFIAMRFIDGPTLAELREELPLRQRLLLMRQVAEAVQAAHSQGLVHRDIKPSNILLERLDDGGLKPYVMDFGIATEIEGPGLTTTGDLLGTPWYMAPERVSWGAARSDHRSDVYSLGVTLYELLSGDRPHDASSPLEVLSRVKDSEPRPLRQRCPELSAELETIVMKCLERDPARRYQSARALADDLGRFLAGQPIAARPASISYRVLSRARRNRSLVAVVVIALLILASMGVATFRTWHQGRVREELAREFGRRVQEIDHVMRMARVAPLHDLGPDKALVREMMQAIRERLEVTGLVGEGSGHYALGRGYLALDEPRRAREHLERAWNRGYRGPEVALSLGVVLGELYRRQLYEAERVSDPEARLRRRQEAEEQLRRPALEYLRAAGGAGGESPEYDAAYTAFVEGDFERALELTEAAARSRPWLYEAHKLSGDIHATVGLEDWQRGDSSLALAEWRAGIAAYRAAVTVARSDGASWLRICELSRSVMELALVDNAGDLEDAFSTGRDGCERALQTEPELSEAYRLLSEIQCLRAEDAMRKGGDPRSSLEAAVRAAARVREMLPGDVKSHLATGEAWLAEARYELSVGGQPQRSLTAATAAFQEAVATDPRSARAHGRLGETWLEQATVDAARGDDPQRSLVLAIASLAEATEIARDDVHAHQALGTAQLRLARVLVERSADPSLALERAEDAFRAVLSINPDYAAGRRGLEEVDRLRSRWSSQTGEGGGGAQSTSTS